MEAIPRSSCRPNRWVALVLCATARLVAEDAGTPAPPPRHDIDLAAPPASWHLGLPIANGEVGAMVWGDGDPLVLTLDRYDVWELRTWKPDPLRYSYDRWRKLIESGRASEIREEFETRHWEARARGEVPTPTRLPLGRIEVRLGEGVRLGRSRLELAGGEALVDIVSPGAGSASRLPPTPLRAIAHATRCVIAVAIPARAAVGVSWRLVPARLSAEESGRLERLGYSPPAVQTGTGWQTMRWAFSGNREVAVHARSVETDGNLLIVASLRTAPKARGRTAAVDTDAGPPDAAALAREEVEAFLAAGWGRRLDEHRAWWQAFWKSSSIRIPDARLEALWYRELYKLGSLSRPGKFPVSLQGLWTKDGGLPPWAGDYHLDMNVQETYWPIYASNHLEMGLPLYEQFSRNLPRYRRMCREFFGFDGCYTRCEQAIDGSEIWGYATTNFWAGNGAWLAQHYWLHWRYSLDFQFLATQAFPFLRSAMDLYLGLLEKGEDGYYHIPVTNSPEFHENAESAWGRDDAGNLALVRFLCEALIEADRVLGAEDPARDRWKDVLANLAPLPGTARDPGSGRTLYGPSGRGGILVMAGRPYDTPHRHLTHLLAIYPLCLLKKGASPDEDRLIEDSVDNVLRLADPIGDWAGWTFPWMSLILGRIGRPLEAVGMLHRYLDGHTYPNGIHENGDWRGIGTTRLRYGEPTVTLEAGFAAAAAVQDLLIQSDGGVIRLFPAVPSDWQDASFERLRAEGAFVVSALRRGGRTASAEILSEKGATLRLATPEARVVVREGGGAEVPLEVDGGTVSFQTRAGATYALEFTRNPATPEGR